MGSLAGLFALGGKGCEIVSFLAGAVGDEEFVVGGKGAVEEARDRRDQAAAGNFKLSGG